MGVTGFLSALVSVAVMLAYAVPGFIFVKVRSIGSDSISAFAKVLMYMCAPCLAVYAFLSVEYTPKLLADLGIFFAVSLVLQLVVIGAVFLVLRKRFDSVRYRVATVASGFGNVSFMGIPLLQGLFPENPEVMIYSIAFFASMSILGWTLGSFLITRDAKHISAKKVLLNPGILALFVALPLFCFQVKLPSAIGDMFTVLGKMTTPLCMLVMGMRLATLKWKPLIADPLLYAVIAVKQLAMPLLALIIFLLPLDYVFQAAMFVCCCCPVASVVLNFTEMLGEGQETAADLVLLGTIVSIVTVPVMLLLV